MIEKRYIISDAAKLIDVESHVLRYWEEELDIEVPRNEMGHRYYTDLYIDLFRKVKELKESGFQLKAIRLLVPSLLDGELVSLESVAAADRVSAENIADKHAGRPTMDASEKMAYFRQIMGEIVLDAVKKNNEELKSAITDSGKDVSDTVIKQVDYLLRIKEEQEEERFKRLDEVIRNYRMAGKEVAITRDKPRKKRWGKKA